MDVLSGKEFWVRFVESPEYIEREKTNTIRSYGGPAPRVSGCIALDLHRMNKVLELNEKFAYAVVEPGVTFGDLYEHCAKNKYKVWPSTASLGWGSVIGNVSAHFPGCYEEDMDPILT